MKNTFYCFIAQGKKNHTLGAGQVIALSSDEGIPAMLAERYAAARDYEHVVVCAQEWEYAEFGPVAPDGSNINWNALWNSAFQYLVGKKGVPSEAAKAALEKTASNKIATFVMLTGKVTFGVPVEDCASSAAEPGGGFLLKLIEKPDRYMPHMFQKNVAAPVLVSLEFHEKPPEADQIAAIQSKTPVKAKLFGGGYVKKAEDCFSYFLNEPFFTMYTMNNAADIAGKAYEKTDLPIRDAGYAIEQINKRIPVDGVSVSMADVKPLHKMLTEAVMAANAAVIGNEKPAGVYNCYTTTDCGISPWSQNIVKISQSEFIILGMSRDKALVYLCYELKFQFYAIQIGKFWCPVSVLPQFV